MTATLLICYAAGLHKKQREKNGFRLIFNNFAPYSCADNP